MEWIHVEDGLPEQDQLVLFWGETGKPIAGWYDHVAGWVCAYLDPSDLEIGVVTHWMPAPNPPADQGEAQG